MNRLQLSALTLLSLVLLLPGALLAGALDDYYLQRFGEAGSPLAGAVLLKQAVPVERCGTQIRRGLKRDWKLLEATTQKTLAKYLALPTLSGPVYTVNSPTGRFRIHYTTSGADATTLAWAQTTGLVFDYVYTYETGTLGFRTPPTQPGAPYDVYLQDRASASEYGYTQEIGPVLPGSLSYTAYTVVDSTFSSSIYQPYSPLQSLQIAAAHEFHHSIQFGYNFYFDNWYGEATSTWMEDEVYDSINQLYEYLPAAFSHSTVSLDSAPASLTTGSGYGQWLFNRFLAERHGTAVVRSFWENLATRQPINNADIPMAPVIDSVLTSGYASSFSAEYLGFTRQVYTRNWQTHLNEINPPSTYIPTYVPIATYSSFPVTATSSPAPVVTLPHYSYAYYKLPTTSAAVTITVNRSPGVKMTAFRRYGATFSNYTAPTPAQTSIIMPATAGTTEIALLVCNPTSSDNQSAAFTTDGTTPDLPSSGGGGGGGCFIATAAYGSYLHPQVQRLRDFRDQVLLTTAPGRVIVACYYRISPPLADYIRRHDSLRAVSRILLAPVIFGIAHPLATLFALLLGPTAMGVVVRKRRNHC